VQEKPTKCKSGQPTQDGSKFSDMLVNNLLISRTERFLMSVEEKMLKDNQSLFTIATMEPIKNGKSYTQTRPRLQHLEFQKLQALESMFHSSLSQDYQWPELLNV